MEEIVKHINDTNASYRALNAGDAKNTDLFLDNEHYELFKNAGEQITVRFNKENLTKAILFIASILPRKYDQSTIHKKIPFSEAFVYDQLAFLNAYFTVDGKPVESRTQIWNARKDVLKKNGETDNRFYFNGLIEEIEYKNYKGETKTSKFTLRNYLAGGFSDIHIRKAENGIFDVRVTNVLTPYDDGKDNEVKIPIEDDSISSNRTYLSALRSKPFMILAGISGTGKSRIVREFAYMTCPKDLQDKDGTTPGNYCMIEVKPNWHDSTELLGYYSAMNKEYVFTKFDRFVVKAWLNPDTPFFVCLDEMNLAPVEQYFAEFLSVLETRSRDQEGNIASGALIEAKYFDDSSKMAKELGLDNAGDEWTIEVRDHIVNKGLTLPPNLMVIGTVNMDDTTYQFSRKVIDRAMTIEMNGGELKNMFGNSRNLQYRVDPIGLSAFKARYLNADEVVEAHAKYANSIRELLPQKIEGLNKVLEYTPFQVSYRVLNELVVYTGVLLDEAKAKGAEINFEQIAANAFDQITLMKILPRIEGDEDMFIRGGQNVLANLQSLFAPESASYKKLTEMKERLERTGFTRFWP